MSEHGKELVPSFTPPVRGRGARANPAGRFEERASETDAETWNALCEAGEEEPERQLATQVFHDSSRSIVSTNDSPDVGIEASVNPYRGCEHGCIYCYARPTHEYLGMSAGLDFETKIFAKHEAAALLREKLSSRGWRPQVVTFSGVTDPYQPLERKLRLTRACLEVLRDFGNPFTIITKNALVTRDLDIIAPMARENLAAVMLSVTTLDAKLAANMEPRASHPARRLAAIEALACAGVPVGVMIGPVLPGLTDHEIPAILEAAAAAGAGSAGYTLLRLPHGVKDLFQGWLAEHYPDRAGKVLNRIRETRGGKLYDSSFGTRMRGTGPHAEQISAMFKLYRKRFGLTGFAPLALDRFRRPDGDPQLGLF